MAGAPAGAMENGRAPAMLNTPRSLATLSLLGSTSATSEGPGEVWACPRFDVEGAGEFPQRPGRSGRPGQPAVLQRDHEEQDEEPASRARDQERRDLVAGEEFDEKGATNRRDRQTHTQ